MTLPLPLALPIAVEPPRPIPISSLLLALVGGALVGGRDELPARARAAATVGGLALIGAAARSQLVESVRRAGTRRRSAQIRMSIVVSHPVEVVFDFLRDFENFPCVIGALRQVRDHGDGRSHWCASTPAGDTIEWDTVTTKYVPNSVIAWQSVVGAAVQMNGIVRFVPQGSSTCLKLAIGYQVATGSFADALVALTTPSRGDEIARDIERLSAYLTTVRSTPTQAPLRS